MLVHIDIALFFYVIVYTVSVVSGCVVAVCAGFDIAWGYIGG